MNPYSNRKEDQKKKGEGHNDISPNINKILLRLLYFVLELLSTRTQISFLKMSEENQKTNEVTGVLLRHDSFASI